MTVLYRLQDRWISLSLSLSLSQIHILQEDWINKSVQLVASCAVTDVNDIRVDKSLPLYCTIVKTSASRVSIVQRLSCLYRGSCSPGMC